MNAVTETNAMTDAQLLEALRENPDVYFKGETAGFHALMVAIEAENVAFKYDLSTTKGKAAIKTFSRQCSTLKTAIDAAGADKVADVKKQAAGVDARRKEMREYLDSQRDARRKPLDDWETQEASRVASQRAIVEEMIQTGCVGFNESSESIQKRIDKIQKVDVSKGALSELAETAAIKKEGILQSLNSHLQQARHNEDQAVQLAELQVKQAESDRKAVEEQAIRDAEDTKRNEAEEARLTEERQKAEKARVEQEKAEAATKAAEDAKREAEEKAEREKQELIRKHEEAEATRKAADVSKRKADEARAADIQHRKKFNNNAMKAIMEAATIGEDRAKKIVTAVASGQIPHVSINY